MAKWRRLCVDVTEAEGVVGASVELYDDTTAGANAVIVCSEQEIDGQDPATVVAYLYEEVGWQQLALPLEYSPSGERF
jgi:fructose-specific phosphotransferase system component IIB